MERRFFVLQSTRNIDWRVENRVLRGIFGPKRGEVTGGGRNYIFFNSFISNQNYSGSIS
jgi:hypothetical protein